MIRDQYAAVGAAAGAGLPVAVRALESAADRGIDVGHLLDRTRTRAGNAERFVEAYRRYIQPVEGDLGLQIAPFQLVASDAETYENRDHHWHLDLADRLVAADPELFRTTRRVDVDLTDMGSREAATAWWDVLTSNGGEGMVVKPFANLTRAKKGLVQPGLKVRGREYLRIIYGADYTSPETLAGVKKRSLGQKRSMALREYALGLEGARRAAAGEPIWRIHQCVFGVLAMESEPVDPRL